MRLSLWFGIVIGSTLYYTARRFLFGAPVALSDLFVAPYWCGATLLILWAIEAALA